MIKRLFAMLLVLGCFTLTASVANAGFPRQNDAAGVSLYLPYLERGIPHDWIGPDGGLIAAVVIDPQNPANVYAGSWGGGVYKSTDGGATWGRAFDGLGNLVVVSLAIDPVYPSILYAGTYRSGVYKSVDAGETWFHANQGIQEGAIAYSLVIDPQQTHRLYVATRGISNEVTRPWAGVVYRSEDGAANWTLSLYNLGGSDYQDWVYALEIDPNRPNVIFGATHEHGPVRSVDYGQSWKVLTNGVTNRSTRAIVVDPRPNQDVVYTGVWTKAGVFKSDDEGDYWELASDGIVGANIYGMAINPISPKTVYAATFNMGVMKTGDGAISWYPAGLGQDSIATLRISPADGNRLFAGTAGDGLYLTQDGGNSWAHSQAHLSASAVNSLVVSPLDPSAYFTGLDGGGVAASTDAGASWGDFRDGLGDLIIHALVQKPGSSLLFALTSSSGLYRCDLEDLGACWQKANLSVAANAGQAAAPGPGLLPESRETFLSVLGEPLQVENPEAAQASTPLLAMAFAPSNPQVAYLGAKEAGVYRSTDGGITWSATAWRSQTVSSLAVHPNDAAILYAAVDQSGTIGFSQDGGASWQNLSLPGLLVYSLAIPPNQPDSLLAGTNDGVYRLSAGVWAQIGLAWQSVLALGMPAQQPNVYVAGTTDGARLSPDGGVSWISGPDELRGVSVQSINFSPHDPDLVFYNTPAMGTLRTGMDY